MQRITRSAIRRSARAASGTALTLGLFACGGVDSSAPPVTQQDFGYTTLNLITRDGLKFKDMDKSGQLEPYEDWRLSADVRARDLVGRLTLAEKAGLMMHGTAPVLNDTTGAGTGSAYDLAALKTLINQRGVNTYITRMSADARTMADQANQIQTLAEQSRLGIPVSISSDPRNHFQYTLGASAGSSGFSQWPETLGFAAIGDTALTRKFGDIARQEYRAVGITVALSPQADLATEPRWARINGTFGEDADLARTQVQAYIEGFQGGSNGIQANSVIAVVKHWAGYGAQKLGFDSHNYYGRYATYPGNNFAYHLKPFEGAFAANVGSVMPTYSEPDMTVTVDGITLEPVGGAYDNALLTDLLRGKYGFNGVIVSDWLIADDCDANCINGVSSGAPSFAGLGMPWGMEGATRVQRFTRAVNAGIDQFGGDDDPSDLIDAVNRGQLSEARLSESAYRVLLQKFQQGLFDHPYVDADAAGKIVGNADFQAQALDAQRRSMVLLQNNGKLLPMTASGKKVWLYGIDPAVARQYGYQVVDTPQAADVAILRVSTPYQTLHPNYMFGSMQHEGSLAFVDGSADYEAIKQAALAPKSIVSVYMDRPAILTNVQDKATAILANFGVTDAALFDVLTGKGQPQGKLPFELPSSMAEVAAQREDVPHDTAHPLYPFGFGLSY
ncbi:glycoside hydrolase family 3 C-terminal domain-containing protein [Burkholderia contaminans]|uniref:glycoside hydrolase family 3 protein n=1 Tax=Burkholderia contaminans TaxID=488447 RepID=UPI001CF27B63|nr:glycoside hydrolase family 3 N-terminal domain-containing protein [Burkholderia contaminans]MCA8154752.1 glycoside hydrolase family 3 C-terminal domain-containing protein [Burkholderia contaminans]